MAKNFSKFQKQSIDEVLSQSIYYAFWGWIIPKNFKYQSKISSDKLINSSGVKSSNGVLYVPSIDDAKSSDEIIHSVLLSNIVSTKNSGYDPGYRVGMYRFLVEYGELRISSAFKINLKDLYRGMVAIDSICNGTLNSKTEKELRELFGHLFENRQFNRIELRFVSNGRYESYYFTASTPSGIISAIKKKIVEIPELAKQIVNEEDTDTSYKFNMIKPLSKNKEIFSSVMNESAGLQELLEAINELANIGIQLHEQASSEFTNDERTELSVKIDGAEVGTATYDSEANTIKLFNLDKIEVGNKKNVMTPEAAQGAAEAFFEDKGDEGEEDSAAVEPEPEAPADEATPSTVAEPTTNADSPGEDDREATIKTIKELEDNLNADNIASDDNKFKLLKNLKEILPVIKNNEEKTAIEELLVNFIDTESINDNIINQYQAIFAGLGVKIMKVLISLNDEMKSAKDLLTVELRQITESIDEAKKKKKTDKKKTTEDKVTPKLEMLLRLGLVPKELFTRAKKALTSKKLAGTIPMYRNLLFDILDEIVNYIEKDPTLYNRMRINVMKEVKNSYPTKQKIMDAFEAGRNHGMANDGLTEDDEVPEEYASDYLMKSAWLRGKTEGCKTPKAKPINESDEEIQEGDAVLINYGKHRGGWGMVTEVSPSGDFLTVEVKADHSTVSYHRSDLTYLPWDQVPGNSEDDIDEASYGAPGSKAEKSVTRKDIEIFSLSDLYQKDGYSILFKYVPGEDRYWFDPYLMKNGEKVMELVDDQFVDAVSSQNLPLSVDDEIKIGRMLDRYLDQYTNKRRVKS